MGAINQLRGMTIDSKVLSKLCWVLYICRNYFATLECLE